MPRNSALPIFALVLFSCTFARDAHAQKALKPEFQTSDRCLACHNQLTTPSGKDVSIGFDWRSSIMANSARDPYWQASVRREDIDHPESRAAIEDSCADCHMPIARAEAKADGHLGEVFAHLPFDRDPKKNASAADGVSCSLCHQISEEKLGTTESFNGGFVIDSPSSKELRPEYGPYAIQNGQAHIMQTSTGGFRPTPGIHMQDSALCATCHTLYTKSVAPDGKEIGLFPEQVPFLEWKHSDYAAKNSCQSCHMPQVTENAPIAAVLGELRPAVRQHTFVGANFFILQTLNLYRSDLGTVALPQEIAVETDRTKQFLQSRAASVTIRDINISSDRVTASVFVENLTGHKLPTAFPSRRAWLHFTVRDANGDMVFESGALNPDGSIRGNHNDADPSQYEPHYREITSSDEVQIYEPILKDQAGHVTTGLAAAVGYLKDNRLLPAGFQKETADKDIAVVGDAANDPNFNGAGSSVKYSVPLKGANEPLHIEAELWYQPIGFRWAHNLAPYQSEETRRLVAYYEAHPETTAIVLARAEVTR